MTGSNALFGGGGNSTLNRPLVEFKAGKMTMKGKMVHPDLRRGLISVEQGDDQLMHFKWKDRSTGAVVDDLLIFPDDIEFKPVPQCKTGRVYILKFKSSSRKMFFWMQDAKTDLDDENCKKVNDFLNDPPTASVGNSSVSGGTLPMLPGLDLSNLNDSDLQALLNSMSQQQLMHMFHSNSGSGAGGGLGALLAGAQAVSAERQRKASDSSEPMITSDSGPQTDAVTSSNTDSEATSSKAKNDKKSNSASSGHTPIQLEDLRSILSKVWIPNSANNEGSSSINPAVSDDQQQLLIDLSSVLKTDCLTPLLSNEKFIEKMKKLLPQEEQDRLESQDDKASNAADDIKSTVQSAQFQQSLSLFSSALQSGMLGPLIREFGLGDDAVLAAESGDLKEFLKALQNQAPQDEDEKMEH